MYIAELYEKYKRFGIERRTIDYYSSKDVELIPCKFDPETGFRVYNDESEDVIKKMIILHDIGFTSQKIKKCLSDPDYFSTVKWNEHIEQLKKKLADIEEMLQYAIDMRDSHSIAYKLKSTFTDDDPTIEIAVRRILTHVYATIFKYLESPEDLIAKSFELSDEISDFTNYCAGFIQLMWKQKEKQVSPESDNVQTLVGKFIDRLSNFYGVAVYLLYKTVSEIRPTSLGLSEEDTEDYITFMQGIEICAKWFKSAKSLKQSQDYETFKHEFAKDIQSIKDDWSADELCDLIQAIANIPSEINADALEQLIAGFNEGVDLGAEKYKDISTENIEEIKAYGHYVLAALKHYVSNSHPLISG